MKKKICYLMIFGIMALTPASVCADDKDNRIAELEAQVEELQAQVSELEKQLEGALSGNPESSNQDLYEIGSTWTVAGQWSITIDSVEETEDRNEYADTDPAAVYIIEYTYENLGYTDANGIMDGLFIDFSMGQIIDSNKTMGYSYPGDQKLYATEVPVGAKMTAQSVIGVDNAGDFTVILNMYDGNAAEQSAAFYCKVE